MAFTMNTIVLARTAEVGGKTPWTVDGYCADVATAQVLRTAPTTGNQVLESIEIDCEALATSETLSIYDGSTLRIGPIPAELGWSWTFRDGLKFAGDIKIKTSATRPIHVLAEGDDI